MKLTHLDAAQSQFFERELEVVKAAAYETDYPAFLSRQFIPVATDVDPGAQTIVWQEFDKVGRAKIVKSYADDAPMVDVSGSEHVGKVRSLSAAYGYSIQDIRAAAMAGRPLEARKAKAAREALELLIDEILAVGDANNDLPGFINAASVPVDNAPNGAAASPLWANKTAAEIRKDVNDTIAAIRSATKGIEGGAVDLLLPDDQYTLIAQAKNSDSSDVTVLQFLLSANPFLRSVQPWWRLDGAGAGAVDRAVFYTRDPGKLEGNVPLDFEQLDPEARNLAYVVNCHARAAGTVFHRPLSARYLDGI